MMKIRGMILCEGETDQALIGYYLMSISNWRYVKNKSSNPFPDKNIVWYKDEQGLRLGIWVVGGNNFHEAIRLIFESEKIEHTIEKIAVVTDHDDSEAEKTRLDNIKSTIMDFVEQDGDNNAWPKNQWINVYFNNSFDRYMIGFCYLLVPVEEQGALETFMLNALSENEAEKHSIICQVRQFLEDFKSEKYLRKRRERIKAELGIAISIMNPDRVFTIMNELLEIVEWSEFDTVHEQFSVLRQI